MPEYLIAVERPCDADADFITVTDGYEGFGPGVLAAYPIERITTVCPEWAGWFYARKHRLLPIRIIVNLDEGYSEHWATEDSWVDVTEEEKNLYLVSVQVCVRADNPGEAYGAVAKALEPFEIGTEGNISVEEVEC